MTTQTLATCGPHPAHAETLGHVIHLQDLGDLCLCYKSYWPVTRAVFVFQTNFEREKYDREEDIIVKFSIL